MTLDARQLKQSYGHEEWELANARERLVLSMLGNMLQAIKKEARERVERARERGEEPAVLDVLVAEAELEARLVGLGAGSSEYIDRTYRGRDEAFDIAVMVNGEPCCYVEVTGVALEGELKEIDGRDEKMYCIGVWKLEKAERHRILDKTWFAFVVGDIGKVRFIKASYAKALSEAGNPWSAYARLRVKERDSVCIVETRWKPPRRFYSSLRSAVRRFLVSQKLEGVR